MSAVAFDSLKYAKNLQNFGFTVEQSEGLAQENLALLEKKVATKDDLEHLRKDIKKDTQITVETLKSDLLKWYISSLFLQIGLVVALIKLL